MALAGLLLFATGARADDQYKILVLAMPGKYHYEYIPIARESLERQAKLHAFELVYTHRPEVFDGDLSQYAMVMFLNTPGEELSEPRRRKFEQYMRNGGNAMLVHRALIIPPDTWPWFEKLIGRRVGNHPMLQTGVAEVVDKTFPATFGLPARWIWSDEWYVFDPGSGLIREIRAYYAAPAVKDIPLGELVGFDYKGRGYHLGPA